MQSETWAKQVSIVLWLKLCVRKPFMCIFKIYNPILVTCLAFCPYRDFLSNILRYEMKNDKVKSLRVRTFRSLDLSHSSSTTHHCGGPLAPKIRDRSGLGPSGHVNGGMSCPPVSQWTLTSDQPDNVPNTIELTSSGAITANACAPVAAPWYGRFATWVYGM